MNQETFESTLRVHARRVPFRPFLVQLVSGLFVRIDHPEALIVHLGVGVYIAPNRSLSVFEAEEVATITTNLELAKAS